MENPETYRDPKPVKRIHVMPVKDAMKHVPSKTTDTPESDAAWEFAWDEGGCHEGHLLDTMMKLERERDEARKAAEEWRSTAGDVAAMPITEHPFSWENDQ